MYLNAVEQAEANRWFLARQFETDANAGSTRTRRRARSWRTSGRTAGLLRHRLRHGRTVTGVGRVLHKHRPGTKIILSEPSNAQIVGRGHVEKRDANGSPAKTTRRLNRIRSRTPDLFPLVLQEAIGNEYYDELIPDFGSQGMEACPAHSGPRGRRRVDRRGGSGPREQAQR